MASSEDVNLPAATKSKTLGARRSRTVKKDIRSDPYFVPDTQQESDVEITGTLQVMASQKSRCANWGQRELFILVDNYLENFNELQAEHKGSQRIETQKAEIWNSIVDAVNR